MQVGTIETTKFPIYRKKGKSWQQVIYKTYLGSVKGKPRWSSQTRHVPA